MSSACWVEPCGDDPAEETELKKRKEEGAEREEAEVPCGQNQPACSLRPEEPEQPVSHDHRGIQEVTSAGGLEKSQREETLRLSHSTVSQEVGRGSGV